MEYKTKVVTGKVRLNYPCLFEPRGMKGQPDSAKTFNAVLLIDKKDKKTIKSIQAAIDAAIDKACDPKGKWKGSEPDDIELPLLDGDKKNKRGEHPEYEGHYYINAKAKPDRPPGVIDINGHELTAEREIFGGCYVMASIDFFAYSFGNKDGVACGILNIMKVADGPAFSAQNTSAQDDFADFIQDDGLRKKRRELEDEDEDDEPTPRRRRHPEPDDEDDEPAPRKRSRREDPVDEDDEPTPRRRSRRKPYDLDDEDDMPYA